MNQIVISGRLTKDVEVKTSSSGTNYARFTLAVDKIGKDKEKKTIFVDCTAFGHQSNFLAKYTHKGSRVIVSGELDCQTKEYEDGTKRTFWSVIANQVEADKPAQASEQPFEL